MQLYCVELKAKHEPPFKQAPDTHGFDIWVKHCAPVYPAIEFKY